MATSQRLRLSEVRAAFHLIGETLEQWDDPNAWRTHFLSGLCRLTGLDRTGWAHVPLKPPVRDPSSLVGPAPSWDTDWGDPRQRHAYRDSIDALNRNSAHIPTMSPLMARLAARPPLVTAQRDHLVPDDQWFHSPFYERHGVMSRSHHFILSAAVLHDLGAVSIFAIHRPDDAPPLQPRQRRLVHLAHCELAPLIGVRLTAPGQVGRHGMTPRQREVLTQLLAGCSESQIASRLHRSRATVHEHILMIYRHFGVASRAELMAYLAGRKPSTLPAAIVPTSPRRAETRPA